MSSKIFKIAEKNQTESNSKTGAIFDFISQRTIQCKIAGGADCIASKVNKLSEIEVTTYNALTYNQTYQNHELKIFKNFVFHVITPLYKYYNTGGGFCQGYF